jgi:hypothetical protein
MYQGLPQLPPNATAADALVFMREITRAVGAGLIGA